MIKNMQFLSKMSKIAIIFWQNLSYIAFKKVTQALELLKLHDKMIDKTEIPCSNCKTNFEFDPYDFYAGLFH